MSDELLDNIRQMILSSDETNKLIGLQIALQDISEEVKSEIFNILIEEELFKNDEFKEDVVKLFNQCSETVIKNRIKKL